MLVEAHKREHTAYHEAGHALAAQELGVLFDRISIVRGEGRLGGVGVEGDDAFSAPPGTDSIQYEAAFREWAEQQATIDYAGHAATVVLLESGDMGNESAYASGAGDDYDKARARLGNDAQRIAKMQARAIALVTKRHEHIARVANALLKHRRLGAQQVDFLLTWGRARPPRTKARPNLDTDGGVLSFLVRRTMHAALSTRHQFEIQSG